MKAGISDFKHPYEWISSVKMAAIQYVTLTKCMISAIIMFNLWEGAAQKLKAARSTRSRRELHKAKPNMKTMKKREEFCNEYRLDYEIIEKEWLII